MRIKAQIIHSETCTTIQFFPWIGLGYSVNLFFHIHLLAGVGLLDAQVTTKYYRGFAMNTNNIIFCTDQQRCFFHIFIEPLYSSLLCCSCQTSPSGDYIPTCKHLAALESWIQKIVTYTHTYTHFLSHFVKNCPLKVSNSESVTQKVPEILKHTRRFKGPDINKTKICAAMLQKTEKWRGNQSTVQMRNG